MWKTTYVNQLNDKNITLLAQCLLSPSVKIKVYDYEKI